MWFGLNELYKKGNWESLSSASNLSQATTLVYQTMFMSFPYISYGQYYNRCRIKYLFDRLIAFPLDDLAYTLVFFDLW